MAFIKSKISALNKSKPRYVTYYARIPRTFYPDVKDKVVLYDTENKAILFVDQDVAEKLLNGGYRVKIELVPPKTVQETVQAESEKQDQDSQGNAS